MQFNLNQDRTYSAYVSSELIEWGRPKRMRRTTAEKKAALDRLTAAGQEETLAVMCGQCQTKVRPVERKQPGDAHYGCAKKCCPLLHQWDMCKDCIVLVHFPTLLVEDENRRRYKANQFRIVFSRLPDDLQRYVGEFVPQIFEFVRLSKMVISDPDFANFDKYAKLPKAVWHEAAQTMEKNYLTAGAFIKKSDTRKTIIEAARSLHARILKNELVVVENLDYWTKCPTVYRPTPHEQSPYHSARNKYRGVCYGIVLANSAMELQAFLAKAASQKTKK